MAQAPEIIVLYCIIVNVTVQECVICKDLIFKDCKKFYGTDISIKYNCKTFFSVSPRNQYILQYSSQCKRSKSVYFFKIIVFKDCKKVLWHRHQNQA